MSSIDNLNDIPYLQQCRHSTLLLFNKNVTFVALKLRLVFKFKIFLK